MYVVHYCLSKARLKNSHRTGRQANPVSSIKLLTKIKLYKSSGIDRKHLEGWLSIKIKGWGSSWLY